MDVVMKPHTVELVLEVSKTTIGTVSEIEMGARMEKMDKKLKTYLRCNPDIEEFAKQEGLAFEPVVRRLGCFGNGNSATYGGFIVFSVKE
jgi:hypothetical protein